jgi:hypothetical protein
MDMTRLTEEEIQQKAEELDNSKLFDVHVWSKYPQVNNAVDELYKMLKTLPDFKGNEKLRKKHVKVVILDLYVKWLEDPFMYSAYHRQKSRYTGFDERYNKLNISYLTVPIVDALVELGYIENYKGHYDRTGKESSHVARMRSTNKLIKLIVEKHKFEPEMVEKEANTECIILRDYDPEKDKQIDVPYEDTAEIKRMRKELYAYNNLLRRTFIDIRHFPKKGVLSRSGKRRIKFNRNEKFVRRIFNNKSWEDGGRFYGGFWQRLPKDWRVKIALNNSPIVEIDYSGLHIVILYAQQGIDYWEKIDKDPYKLEEYYEVSERMRSLLKQVLLTSINAKDKSRAVKGVMYDINMNQEEFGWVREEEIEIGEVIERFANLHKPIRNYFFSNYGVKLQKIDSMMAEHIINEMTKEDLPVLCVHDSFIVESRNGEKLKGLMEKAFMMILSTLTNLDDNTIARMSTKGMSTGDYNYLRTIAVNMSEPDDRDMALTRLGVLKPGDEDWEYDKRFRRFKSIEWEKEYYFDNST